LIYKETAGGTSIGFINQFPMLEV